MMIAVTLLLLSSQFTSQSSTFNHRIKDNQLIEMCPQVKILEFKLRQQLKLMTNQTLPSKDALLDWLQSSKGRKFFTRTFAKKNYRLGSLIRRNLIRNLHRSDEDKKQMTHFDLKKSILIDECRLTFSQSKNSLSKRKANDYDSQVSKMWFKCRVPIQVLSQGMCNCANIIIKDQRYPCYQCNCTNVNELSDIPLYVRTNVFKLHLIHFKGSQFRVNKPLINLRTLNLTSCNNLRNIEGSDFNGLINLESITIKHCLNLTKISLNFEPSLLSKLHSLRVHKCINHHFLHLNNTSESVIALVEIKNCNLICGCTHKWMSEQLLNQKQLPILISLDYCLFRGVQFEPHHMRCDRCSEICTDDKCVESCSEISDGAFYLNDQLSTNQSYQAQLLKNSGNQIQGSNENHCVCIEDTCECNKLTGIISFDVVLYDPSHLSINDCKYNTLTSEHLRSLHHLRSIKFDRCCIKSVDKDVFEKQLSLTDLQITNSKCELTFHPLAFRQSILTKIHIRNTLLSSALNLTELDNRLTKLEIIDSNVLECSFLENLKMLNFLRLSAISLVIILNESLLAGLLRLRYFNADRNPLDCSCDNSWIHRSELFESSDITCQLSDYQEANLKLYDPCGLCSTIKCINDNELCFEDESTVSRCTSVATITDACNKSENPLVSNYRCDQFQVCDSEGSFTLTCPPTLYFDVKTNLCKPLQYVQCQHRKINMEDKNDADFRCPLSIDNKDYNSMNRHLRDEWDLLAEGDDKPYRKSVIQFIEHYGIFVHDINDCQAYHRCHYDQISGRLLFSKHHRCVAGSFFNNQHDTCVSTKEQYMNTHPNLSTQCRCNILALQQRYVNWFREKYTYDPSHLPLAYGDNDLCSGY